MARLIVKAPYLSRAINDSVPSTRDTGAKAGGTERSPRTDAYMHFRYRESIHTTNG